MEAAHQKCLSRILGIHSYDHVTNEEILHRITQDTLMLPDFTMQNPRDPPVVDKGNC